MTQNQQTLRQVKGCLLRTYAINREIKPKIFNDPLFNDLSMRVRVTRKIICQKLAANKLIGEKDLFGQLLRGNGLS